VLLRQPAPHQRKESRTPSGVGTPNAIAIITHKSLCPEQGHPRPCTLNPKEKGGPEVRVNRVLPGKTFCFLAAFESYVQYSMCSPSDCASRGGKINPALAIAIVVVSAPHGPEFARLGATALGALTSDRERNISQCMVLRCN
jgi:hypothetical protein